MSDQVTNKSTDAEQSQVGMVETALPFSTAPSDKLLSRIAILLFILVAGLLTVFGYYASSICITVILAGFLAILFDPVVVLLEKLHLPRSCRRGGHCARRHESSRAAGLRTLRKSDELFGRTSSVRIEGRLRPTRRKNCGSLRGCCRGRRLSHAREWS
jgi:hypothetical protein